MFDSIRLDYIVFITANKTYQYAILVIQNATLQGFLNSFQAKMS
jgi:hypothetical protein